MIPVDFQRIQNMKEFMEFILMLAKPELVETYLEELKKADIELTEKLGIHNSLEKVEALRVQLQKDFDQRNQELEFQKQLLEKDHIRRQLELDDLITEASMRKQEADANLARQILMTAEADKQRHAYDANLREVLAREAAVSIKEVQLKDLEASLVARSERLKKLVGE